MPSSALLQDLEFEVNQLTENDLHPKVDALVSAFLSYLKEPRYQNPLTLGELKKLFDAFYEDLYSLVFHIYTQSNTNKRQLLQKSEVFKSDPKTFDYLNAIANYSSSSVKLSKRTDPEALYQLRVFGFYKLLMILKTIELAQSKLYTSSNPPDSTSLYEKVIRFDSRDIEIQNLLSEKIGILRQLNLPIQCFLDSENEVQSKTLERALLSLNSCKESPHLAEMNAAFTMLASAQTPAKKLEHIVSVQKSVIRLCATCYGNDHSKISNDVLLPAFIYVIVNHAPLGNEEDPFDFYLHFMFVKNFWKPLDLQKINASRFTLSSSLHAYDPMDKRSVLPKNNQSRTLANLLNLDGNLTSETCPEKEPEFATDETLIQLIQNDYIRPGELQFCLTNCEAILFFLSSTPISGIATQGVTIPPEILEKELMNLSLHEIIHKKDEESEIKDTKDLQKLVEEELDAPSRSRSSSLFNTISSAVTHSVNRSRSNSEAKNTDPFPHKEVIPNVTDFESSLKQSHDTYGLNRVRGIFERIGSVPHLQLKTAAESEEQEGPKENLERTPEANRVKRSASLFDRLSPSSNRTRSGSLENLWNAQGASLRRATLTNKFSTGMNELMTKISSAANNATASSVNVTNPENVSECAHQSSSSVHSIEDPFEDNTYTRRESLGARSSSLQTMEKWFCNIPENSTVNTSASHRSNTSISSNRFNASESNFNGDSVFSASFGELTKYRFTDFDSMTINDLKNLKVYYDQLCSEVLSGKTGSKTSNEFLPEDAKEVTSNVSSLEVEREKSDSGTIPSSK